MELLYSALLIGLLTGLAIYYYRPYILNAYALDALYSIYDIKTHVAIEMAYTGLPQGAKGDSGYSHLTDHESAKIQNAKVTQQGHIMAHARVAHREFYQNPMHNSIEGKSVALYRTVNDQGAYIFHSWQCNPKGNEAPFVTEQADIGSDANKLLYTIYCNGNKL